MVDRIIDTSQASATFTLAEWVLGIPRLHVEAIAVFPGLGEEVRILHAIQRWRENSGSRIFFAGVNPGERTFSELTLSRLRQEPYLVEDVSRVRTGVRAEHTAEQAQWLVSQVTECGVRSCELHAPPYHIVRAYLTVLAAMDLENPFILIPHPTPIPPNYDVPEIGTLAIDMTQGEHVRIERYQSSGDVAGIEQLKRYLGWFWEQPELDQ